MISLTSLTSKLPAGCRWTYELWTSSHSNDSLVSTIFSDLYWVNKVKFHLFEGSLSTGKFFWKFILNKIEIEITASWNRTAPGSHHPTDDTVIHAPWKDPLVKTLEANHFSDIKGSDSIRIEAIWLIKIDESKAVARDSRKWTKADTKRENVKQQNNNSHVELTVYRRWLMRMTCIVAELNSWYLKTFPVFYQLSHNW